MNTLILIPTVFEARYIEPKPQLRRYIQISKTLYFGIPGIGSSGIKFTGDIINQLSIDQLILLGMCGDLTGTLALGSSYIIDKVTDKKNTIAIQFPQELWQRSLGINNPPRDMNRPADLVTVKKPVYTQLRRAKLSVFAPLVDMVAAVAADDGYGAD